MRLLFRKYCTDRRQRIKLLITTITVVKSNANFRKLFLLHTILRYKRLGVYYISRCRLTIVPIEFDFIPEKRI